MLFFFFLALNRHLILCSAKEKRYSAIHKSIDTFIFLYYNEMMKSKLFFEKYFQWTTIST